MPVNVPSNIYFGTVESLRWLPAPAINMPVGNVGWGARFDYQNGAADADTSWSSHREYEMVWETKSTQIMDAILAYKSGAYGKGLLYYLDPAAMAHNVMPHASWAHAALACYDGPNLAGVNVARPTVVATASNTQDYPIESAFYTLAGTETVRKVTIPVPTGYTLHLGAHGSRTGTAGVSYLPSGGTVTALTLLGNNVTTLTNATVVGPKTVEVYLTGAGTLTLSAVVAQILPSSFSAPIGTWRTGRGTWGLKFLSHPQDTLYSAYLDYRTVTAQFVEVW